MPSATLLFQVACSEKEPLEPHQSIHNRSVTKLRGVLVFNSQVISCEKCVGQSGTGAEPM